MTLQPAEEAIGIFDSGIGGLTVANAVVDLLPNERIIYFGDTAHMPYGEKSADAIRYYSLKIAKFLIDQPCKLVAIACNSASSAAYNVLLEFFKDQALFVNVVDPLVQFVVEQDYRKIAVIGTKATITSGIYFHRLSQLKPSLEVFSLATPLLAPMIEEGLVQGPLCQSILQNYFSHPGFNDIDAVLLACTHYPIIKQQIASFFSDRIAIIDSGQLTAAAVKNTLLKNHLLQSLPASEPHHFYVSDLTESFVQSTSLFYGKALKLDVYEMW